MKNTHWSSRESLISFISKCLGLEVLASIAYLYLSSIPALSEGNFRNEITWSKVYSLTP